MNPSITQRLRGLNPRQQQAVRYIDGPCLVLAGAGSGKTSVITTKIAYLVKECGMSARKIAAVTFTNKAAREMKERVGQMLKGKEGHGLTVSTFHTLGLNIIRSELNALGYRPGFSLFDPEDAKALLRDLMNKDAQVDAEQINAVQRQISQWKNDLVLPGDALSFAADNDEQGVQLANQAMRVGADAYFNKPIPQAELEALIRSLGPTHQA